MPQTIKESFPRAYKTHRCMYCGCIIGKGETYHRETIFQDGELLEWKSHTDCGRAAELLDMFSECIDGVGGPEFAECVAQYLDANYTDGGNLPEEIERMSNVEKVRMIIRDWDTPRLVMSRLAAELSEAELMARTFPTDTRRLRRAAELRARMEELKTEEQI